MARLLAGDLYEQMIAAADAAGATRINARMSWIVANLTPGARQETSIQQGRTIAKLRCSPAPCIELWAVTDDAIAADWEVVP